MLKIRCSRKGNKKLPSYRIILIDSKRKRDSIYLEDFGFYQPTKELININLKKIQE